MNQAALNSTAAPSDVPPAATEPVYTTPHMVATSFDRLTVGGASMEEWQAVAHDWPQCQACGHTYPSLTRGLCRKCYSRGRARGEVKLLAELQPKMTPCELVADFLSCADRGRDIHGLARALGYSPKSLARRLRRYAAALERVPPTL